VQQHEGPNDAGDLAVVPGTTYTYNYEYNQSRPHAVASINDGSITFRYDASGNMTARYNEEENSWRTLHWDAENRLVKTIDNDVATNYAYDAEGTRVTKSGSSGEVTYVDPAYVIRNNSIIGKHVFVGNTRVASKMDVTGVLADEEDEDVSGVYYYHADHLGSSSVVTGKEGGFHERIEYFPYGETWVEDKASTDGYSTPYRYTAKEYDPETGLYYFGARYYDARLSRWVSADPILGKYLPTGNKKRNDNLPGMGGVFNSVNLNLYHYSGCNPVLYVDPDGRYQVESKVMHFLGQASLGICGSAIPGSDRKRLSGYTATSDLNLTFGEDNKAFGEALAFSYRATKGVFGISLAEAIFELDFTDSTSKKNLGVEGVSTTVGFGISMISKLGNLGGPLGALASIGISEAWNHLNKEEQNNFADILTFKIYEEQYGAEGLSVDDNGFATLKAKHDVSHEEFTKRLSEIKREVLKNLNSQER